MNTYYGVNAWSWSSGSDALYHHGILGQKWGKRNGPPYPLSAGSHSSAEKRLKSKNDGTLESWKAHKTAKIDKAYGKKIGRVDAAIFKTSKASKLERLKSKKAQLLFKQSMKKIKVMNTTEKQYAMQKKIKRALKIVGAITVTALALYAINKIGGQHALNRMLSLQKESDVLHSRNRELLMSLLAVNDAKGSEEWKKSWTKYLMKEHEALSNPIIFNYRALRKASNMNDIYQYGTIFEKIITQIKGF